MLAVYWFTLQFPISEHRINRAYKKVTILANIEWYRDYKTHYYKDLFGSSC
jgi:hypothetical protein